MTTISKSKVDTDGGNAFIPGDEPLPAYPDLEYKPSVDPDHRILTVHQPHATLLAGGIKTYETRSWNCSFRGLLFIHAGMLVTEQLIAIAWERAAQFETLGIKVDRRSADSSFFHLLPRGSIIGACRLVDCTSTIELLEAGGVSPLEQSIGDFSVDRFGWKCQDAILFKQPVACKGRQGLQFLTDNILAQAMDQIHASGSDLQAARLLAPVSSEAA